MTDGEMRPHGNGREAEYTSRLERLSGAWWKRVIGAQAPYRRNIRRVVEGRVLDVGCGIGRNLNHLDGNGVGVDTNEHSVDVARSRGLTAYSADEFPNSPDYLLEGYETLLFSHVLEHMDTDDAVRLVTEYLPQLARGGRVVIIVPQEAGFRSDPTHVAPVGLREIGHIARSASLEVENAYSFPFPRLAGRFFRHNEIVALLRKP